MHAVPPHAKSPLPLPRPRPRLAPWLRHALIGSALLASVLTGCARRSYHAAATTPDAPPSVLAGATGGGGVRRERVSYTESIQVAGASASARSVSFSGLLTGLGGGGQARGPQVAQVVPAAVSQQEKLVVEAWIRLQTDDVAKTAAAVIARVEADGGRVVSSNLVGSERAASSAALELRVPPEKAGGFQAWLGSQGVVESRRTLASDVGKLMFDQQLALQNLELTMSRLQKLAEKELPMSELLDIEKEMTRVRGDIERLKGEQRWLADRVALATVTLTLVREGGPIELVPRTRLFPGPRLAILHRLDGGGPAATRVGGGVTLHASRYFTLDFDLFPRQDGDSRAALATMGTALYSNHLGGGRRRFLNPYLGLRAGYGYLSGESSFVVAGEVGLELFKHRYLLVEVAGRAIAFLGDEAEGAVQGTFGVAVPF